MTNIIVVLPKLEEAKGVKNILVRSGFQVTGICTTGTQAISQADGLNDGIVICSYKLADMIYTELHEDLMVEGVERRRRKRRMQPKVRNATDEKAIKDAKELLMARNHMTEEEAHRYLQKTSMDSGTNLVETAQMVLSMMTE